MRAVYAIVLFVFFCSVSFARADVIVSGSESTSAQGATPCSNSGAAPESLTLNCSSSGTVTTSTESLFGSGNVFGGSIGATSDVMGGTFGSGSAMGTIELMLNQSYVVTGGTGTTTVFFDISGFTSTASPSCSFTFNGVAQSPCMPFAQTYSETVQYGVPFSVDLDLKLVANAINGAPSDGSFSYVFNQPGLQETPEPSSALLLLPGLVGVFLAAKSRATV